jgi:hypothetical protein
MALSDTSPEAERVLIDVHRKMSVGQKWLQLGDVFRTARVLHAGGFLVRHPGATDREVQRDWVRSNLGQSLCSQIGDRAMSQPVETLQVIREVAAAFDRLAIPYAIGGSIASSVLGLPRYTQDADFTVEPFPGREAELVARFGTDYYLSLPAVERAVRERSSFNIIHTTRGFKVDVFVRKERRFAQEVLSRRAPTPLPDAPEQPLFFVSPEDVILLKLEWFRLGGETSERQWGDLLGVLKVQADKLDRGYLDRWATDLGVSDLLSRAQEEAGRALSEGG